MDTEIDIKKKREYLINAQKQYVDDMNKAKEIERKKVEAEKADEIATLNTKLKKIKTDNENLKGKVTKLKKQIKLIASRAAEEVDKKVASKISSLDFAPKILELCDEIDENIGGKVSILKGISDTLGDSIDETSKQRLFTTLNNLQENIEVINKILEIDNIADNDENIIEPIVSNTSDKNIDDIDATDSKDKTQLLHFKFE